MAPGLFQGRHINVEIETGSTLTRGMTVADWWRVTARAPNAMFMREVDAEGFFGLLTERIGRLLNFVRLLNAAASDSGAEWCCALAA